MIGADAGFGGKIADFTCARRLWSLWDMFNFIFTKWHRLLQDLGILIQVSRSNMSAAPSMTWDEKGAMADCVKNVVDLVKISEELNSALNSAHLADAARRLKNWTTRDVHEWSELNTRARGLRNTLETELGQYLYWRYPKDKGFKLLTWETDWKGAISSFSSAKRNIFCAVDCYALEHNDACVFHCMLILECGLRELANDVGLTFDVQQWNEIIEQIESKIRQISQSLSKGMPKNERMQFLAEAAKEFFYFKDAWRNYVAHGRGNYDEHQAASVLDHVRVFMNHLSTKLSE
jgi:hypothetical protein